MKSNGREISEGRIEKVTELLWKIWWFFFYLLIVPSLIALIGFYIINFLVLDLYISSGFAVLIFIFSIFVFYKPFDKYRVKSFFRNKHNNPRARIHILYLVSILALVVTPIFVYITPEDYFFELLPLISYCVLYIIVYFYYSYQPIDYFDNLNDSFERYELLSDSLKKYYNVVIIINFVSHVVFLSYTFETKLSWFFALASDLIFYLISFFSTKKVTKNIENLIQNKQPIEFELNEFKHKFSISIISLVFTLLIQMPFVVILVFSFSGQQFSYIDLFTATLYSTGLILFYFKTRVYFSIYHNKNKIKLEGKNSG